MIEVLNLTARKGTDQRYDTAGRTMRFAVAQYGERLNIKGDVEAIPTAVKKVIVLEPGENKISQADFDALYRDGAGALFIQQVRLGKLRVRSHEALEAMFGTDEKIEKDRLAALDASSILTQAEKDQDNRVEQLESQVEELTKMAAKGGDSSEIEQLREQVAELTALVAKSDGQRRTKAAS